MIKKVGLLLSIFILCNCSSSIPLPTVEDGIRGSMFGIDKNINEKTIDKYLNRKDCVYFDLRMLKDEANYEQIGGDSYLSGYVKGFEILPYPFLATVTSLPEEVGVGYTGDCLYSILEDGSYVANFKESFSIIESYFPHDKYIFLMCGGGGYASMGKKLLIALGYDENKIYNVGGYWYYNGKNKVQVKKEIDGNTTYDFENVPYHNIDFSTLTKNEKDN